MTLEPTQWRINILPPSSMPAGHEVVAIAESKDFYINQTVAGDFVDLIRDAYNDYEEPEEQPDNPGLQWMIDQRNNLREQYDGVALTDEEYSRLTDRLHEMEESIMQFKKLPNSIPKFGLTEDQVKAASNPVKYHTKESWAAWKQRNVVDPELIYKIHRVAFKEAPVTDLLEHAGAMLSNDWYSPEVAKAYRNAKKLAEMAYKDMVDKAHEEAIRIDQERDLWRRVEKERVEQLCEAADETLEEFAERAAAKAAFGNPITHHHSGGGDKRFEGALEDEYEECEKMIEDARQKAWNNFARDTEQTMRKYKEGEPRNTGKTFRSWLCNYFK